MPARTERRKGAALLERRCMVLIAAGVIAAGGLAAEVWAQSPTVPSVNVGNLPQIIGPSPLGSESETRTMHPAFGIADGPGESSVFTRRLPIAVDAGALQTALLAADVRVITVCFKLDPSLFGGTYGQIPCVSPRVYYGIRGQKTVEARAGGLDRNGGAIAALNVRWIPANPTMVTVSPTQAALVKITVRKPGQSRLRMVYGRLSKTLLIKAVSEYGLLRLTITQL
jgi:hypothetical protein